MAKALVIIDYQAGVSALDGIWRWQPVLETLARAAEAARAAGMPVIYVQHDGERAPFVPETPGWEFPAKIAPRPGEAVVRKRSCDGFRDTQLVEELERFGVDEIVVGGYATDFCVDTTVRRAASMGISTTVLADGHTARERPHVSAAQVVDHFNWLWPEITNPGNPIRVSPSADVFS